MAELPPGWTVRTVAASRTGRAYTVVTAPDGTRCTWMDEGGVRLHRPAHAIQIGEHTRRQSGHKGDSLNLEFEPVAD